MASGKYSLPRVLQILNTRTLNATNTCKHIHTYLHTCTFLHHTFMEESSAMDRRNTHILSTSKSKQNWTRKYSSKSGLQSLHIWVLINKSSQVSIVFSVNFFILLLSDNSFRTWCSNCEHLRRKVCSMRCCWLPPCRQPVRSIATSWLSPWGRRRWHSWQALATS